VHGVLPRVDFCTCAKGRECKSEIGGLSLEVLIAAEQKLEWLLDGVVR